MKVVLLSVGKTDDPKFIELIEEYRKRVNFYLSFQVDYVSDVKKRKGLSITELMEEEGKKLLAAIQPSDHVVLLDDKGRQYTSMDFARMIEKKMHVVSKRLVFVVGGPYGFSRGVYERGDEKLSLSPMTLTHQMVRLFFAEQLYRAMTILNNEPYHHE